MPGMNSERQGYFGPQWQQAERAPVNGTGSGSNGFDFNTKGLDDLKTKLAGIISQFDQLDKKIGSVSGKLGGITGGGAAGGGSLTTGSFANSPAAQQVNSNLANFGKTGPASAYPQQNQTQGPGGTGNTSAGFGGISAGQAMMGVAGAGAAAGIFGKVSGMVSGLQAGGVPVQLAAAQQAGITGGSTFGNINAWNGVMNTGQADQAAAQNMALQNPFLSTLNPQSKNFNNMKQFLNSTQKLGGIGASSAMGFLNDLTSTQATNFFTQRTGGRAGPWNPYTGQMRGPQQSLLGALQGADPGLMGMSGSKLSSTLKNISKSPGSWMNITNQLEGQAGLSSSDVELLHQFASSGGNLKKATGGQVSNTVAEQLLSQTTQKTSQQNNLMQETSGLQVAFSKLSTTVSHLEQTLAGWTLGRGGGALGGLVSGLASHIGLGDPDTTSGMQPNLAHGITAMKAANPNLQINSGYRSSSQQSALYALKGGQGVARPGQSPHQLGKAADIGPPSQFGWLAANAQKFGLATDKHEPWHVQAIGDPSSAATVTGAQVLSVATTQLGVPYSWGGGSTSGPSTGTAQGANTVGFDCSHFVQYVFAKIGISVPPPSQSQAKMGKPVASLAQAQAGDLLFFNYEGPNSHVGIYIGNNKMIDAPATGQTVSVQSVDTGHLDSIRRIIGGGGGGAGGVVAAAQQAVGMPSNDSHSGSTTPVAQTGGGGLANTFVAGLSGSWLAGGGPSGAGGGAVGGSPTTAGSTGGTGSTSSATSSSTSSAGATPSTGSLPSTGTLTPNQVQQAWIQAGGPSNVAATMAGIAMAESSDEPGAIQKGQPYATTGWGLWQITPGNSDPQIGTDQALLNPVTNAKAALAKYKGAGNTLRPWTGDHYLEDNHISPSSSGVGDPVGGFTPNIQSGPMGGPGPVSSMRSGGGGGVNVTVGPIYVQGTQADANNIANMVASAIKGNKNVQTVAKS